MVVNLVIGEFEDLKMRTVYLQINKFSNLQINFELLFLK